VATKALPTETGSNKLGQTYGTPRQSSTRPGYRRVDLTTGSWQDEGESALVETRPAKA